MKPLRGYHVAVDGIGDPSRWTPALARAFCRGAVVLARMTLIEGPHAARSGDALIAIAVLAESHVSVHLNLRTGAAHADLFSCQPFDHVDFAEFCSRQFGLRERRVLVLRRDVPASKDEW